MESLKRNEYLLYVNQASLLSFSDMLILLDSGIDKIEVIDVLNGVEMVKIRSNLTHEEMDQLLPPDIKIIENEAFSVTSVINNNARMSATEKSTLLLQRDFKIIAPLQGKGIKVGVIDSGIADTPYINVAGGVSFINNSSPFIDKLGHGTGIASIISANVPENSPLPQGIAPHVDLYSIKVFDDKRESQIYTWINGINWAIENNMDILNLSLYTFYFNNLGGLQEAIRKAEDAGILIVAGAGNEGRKTHPVTKSNTVVYPGKYEEVIAVGAVSKNGVATTFSSRGSEVELVALGEGVHVIARTGKHSIYVDGTSFATPHVVAIAALFWAENRHLSAESVRYYLQRSAIPNGINEVYGYGIVNFPSEPVIYIPDVIEHWAKDYILNLTLKGKIQGYSDGSFRPDQTISRGHALLLLNQILATYYQQDSISIKYDMNLIPDWLQNELSYFLSIIDQELNQTIVTQQFYFQMFPYNSLEQNALLSITRQEVLQWLFPFLLEWEGNSTRRQLENETYVRLLSTTFGFVDNSSIEAVLAKKHGIFRGNSQGMIEAERYITRAEFSAILHRLDKYLSRKQRDKDV